MAQGPPTEMQWQATNSPVLVQDLEADTLASIWRWCAYTLEKGEGVLVYRLAYNGDVARQNSHVASKGCYDLTNHAVRTISASTEVKCSFLWSTAETGPRS